MYWRSRAANPVNGWYFQQAQMSVRVDEWVVFGIGLTTIDAFGAMVSDATGREPGWVAVDEPDS